MKAYRIIVLLFLSFSFIQLFAQDDPVLFTVNERPVTTSEFSYIYNKSNAESSDFSEASLRDYLDLYINFKLKVEEARASGYDTLPKLQNELKGYYNQLSESYLIDNGVMDDLLLEAYERKKTDIKLSHIYTKIDPSQSEKLALEKIQGAEAVLKKGGDFAKVAMRYSDDTYSKDNGGTIGYLTALFPMGFYDMENAAYNTAIGEISGIVRSPQGFHILKVEDRRKARGVMEIAHIFIAKTNVSTNSSVQIPNKLAASKPKDKIDAIYAQLNAKELTFEEAAKQFSEDKKTGFKGGNLGFIAINQYEEAFENAAFSIAKDGAYSTPVESAYGWHIIKRISKKPFGDFATEKNRLKAQIQRDARFTKAKAALTKKIQKEYGFTENEANLNAYTSTLDASFLDYKWQPKAISNGDQPIFTIGDQTYDVASFIKFSKTALRERAKGKNANLEAVIKDVYQSFLQKKCLDYEKANLANKYPVYKSLRREYEEGVYLFEIMKKEVWDKASADTTGLKTFFADNREKYMWEERAEISKIIFQSDNEKLIKKFNKYLKKGKSLDYLSKKLNKNGSQLKIAAIPTERKDLEDFKIKNWKVGSTSAEEVSDNGILVYRFEKVIPPSKKELSEARGYVIADYQDFVEKEWIKSLKAKYPVVLNEDVLKSLVKK